MNEAPLPEPAPRAPPNALILVAGVVMPLLFLTVGIAAQTANLAFGVWFTEVFVFLGAPFVLLRLSGRDPVRYPGASDGRMGPPIYGFALGAVNFFAVALPILAVAQLVFPESWVQASDGARIFRDRSAAELWILLAGVTIAAPLGEEYLFRGVLQNALHEKGVRPWVAIGVTSVVFSAMHFDPVGFVARAELGVVFGWLFWRTRSIWPGALAHSANNAVTSALFFAAGGETTSAQALGTEELLLSVLLPAAIGLSGLAGLLLLPKGWPKLLEPRPSEPRALPPPRIGAAAAPWALAAVACVAMLLAFDHRGVWLNFVDAARPVPETLSTEQRGELKALRARAREGAVTFSEYERARRRVAEEVRAGGAQRNR